MNVITLVVVFPLIAAARRSPHAAVGSELRASRASTGAYDVRLLVTRHGLSCTNIVEKWVNKFDAGRRHMHDPLLGGVGVLGCNEARATVDHYLEQSGLPQLDAVLSSVLARAMETALLSYPQATEVPLYVVPYIREYASGASNAPKDHAAQLADLNTTIPHPFQVDYQWVDKFGSDKGSWDQFLYFLEQSFLPDLIARLEKPPGSQIILPVVTHSLFMRDSDVGEKCRDHFKSNPSKKPLNNQVVDMAYTFHSGKSVPTESGIPASTVVFTIEESGEPRAVGHWKMTGFSEGRAAYANVLDTNVVIRWSEKTSAWQLVTTAAFLPSTLLYEAKQDELVPPSNGWKVSGYWGKEPAPTLLFKDDQHSLRETDVPCKSVYPGVSLKDDAGSLRSPICLKDVGESCIEPIKKYSWAPGVLWQQTYEGKIDERNKTITSLQEKQRTLEHDLAWHYQSLEETHDPQSQRMTSDVIQNIKWELQDVKFQISDNEKRRAELAATTCWSGGNPDVSRGNPGTNSWSPF